MKGNVFKLYFKPRYTITLDTGGYEERTFLSLRRSGLSFDEIFLPEFQSIL